MMMTGRDRLAVGVLLLVVYWQSAAQLQPGVQLILEPSQVLPNITIVIEDQLGEANNGLICQSNDTSTFTAEGVWRAPNGVNVPVGKGSGGPVYVLQAPLPTTRTTLYRQLPSPGLDDSDVGVYTCMIPDSNGQEFVLYAGLYRTGSTGTPVMQHPPLFQLLTPLSQYPASFLVTCVSSQFPPTHVNWTRNGELLSEGSVYHLTQVLVSSQETVFNNTIIVTASSSLPGVFSCAISNNLTAQPVVAQLNVTEPSSPPVNITSDPRGRGNVIVSWLPPPGAPVRGYHLLYQRVGSPSVEQSVTTLNTNVFLRALAASATYNFSVVAFSELPSPRSDPISLTLTVTDAPANLTLTPQSPTVLLVSWDKPAGTVVEYIVAHMSTGLGCEGVSDLVESVTKELEFNLTGLEEDEQYSVFVRAVSPAAVGPPTPTMNVTTPVAAPSAPPMNIQVNTTDPSTINISWTPPPCLHRNGILSGYVIRYNDTTQLAGAVASQLMNINNDSVLSASLTGGGLLPFRNYSIEVAAVVSSDSLTGNLTGVFSTPVYTNLVGVPNAVSGGIITPGITSANLSWATPSNVDGAFNDTISYIVRDLNTSNYTVIDMPSSPGMYAHTVTMLYPNSTVSVNVSARSTFSIGTALTLTTATMPIPVVDNVGVVLINMTSVRVSWSRQPSTDIVQYRIYYNSSMSGVSAGNVTTPSSNMEQVVSGLTVGATYQFQVVAVVESVGGVELEGIRSTVFMITIPVEELLSDTQRTIIISVFSGAGGLLLIILVTVIFLAILHFFTRPLLAHKDVVVGDHVPLVAVRTTKHDDVAAHCPNVVKAPTDVHVIAGQEVVLRVEFSGFPPPEFSWKFGTRELVQTSSLILTRDGALILPRVSPEDDGHYFVTAKNKHGSVEQRVTLVVHSDDDNITPVPKDNRLTTFKIPLSEFGQQIADLHAENNQGFKDQFKRLPDFEKQNTVMSAAMNQHRQLNRQHTVLAYDDNRVELTPLKRYMDCQHDYINASYVDGYSKTNAFIATQGPLDRTVVDFWRMVWEVRSPTIVMVTELQEDMHIKSSKYWPSLVGQSEKYGPFKVTLVKEDCKQDYTIRILRVNDASSVPNLIVARLPRGSISAPVYNPLYITHCQYTAWPEYSSPEHIDSLLAFQREALSAHNASGSTSPMVVHCSCGVGRTGAFILLSNALEQAKKEKTVDLPAAIIKMRKQRMQMVQTLTQYMAAHDALLEGAVCGVTHFPVLQLSLKIQDLSVTDPATRTNVFESQFNVLEAVTVAPSNAFCSVALKFSEKNRNESYLPMDKWRVPLLSEQPDYIHASFVPSYLNNRTYIVTQGPLATTRRDFFKMVFDRDVVAIVMLTDTEENGQEVCTQYWSAKDSQQEFGEFVVTQKKIHHNQGFTCRTLLITNTASGDSRKISQYQILGWSADGVEYNIGAIVNTINLVTMAQRKTANCPILVHCSDGVSRSAMLCAAMATLEQTRSHAMVDVFQIVKKMRSQLLGAIRSWEQYRAIHLIVEEYVNLFSTTANFMQHKNT